MITPGTIYVLIGVVAAGHYLRDSGGLWDWRGTLGLLVLAIWIVIGWPLFVGLDVYQRLRDGHRG